MSEEKCNFSFSHFRKYKLWQFDYCSHFASSPFHSQSNQFNYLPEQLCDFVCFRCFARIFILLRYSFSRPVSSYYYWHAARIVSTTSSNKKKHIFADQLTMTKTFRQQNVRRMLEIELRGINKNLSKSTFRIINQLFLTKYIHCFPFFFLSSFSFNRQF